MEKKDVETLLKRIKYNYNEFRIDDYTMVEWYKELKDYALEDVMEKLEQHFRNEQYGNSVPKVYFLTKYLVKEKEKKSIQQLNVRCQYCNEVVTFEQYDKHCAKCRSINYIQKQALKYAGREIDREELLMLDDESFEQYYNKVLGIVERQTKEPSEKRIIRKLLYNEELELSELNIV